MKSIIDVKNLSFRYKESQEYYNLKDITFHVKRGEWLSIVGHNGSGKSTTVRLIDGLLEAESGEIWIDGDCLTPENVWEKRRKIGMVFQNPDNQFVGATVEDDVAFGLENQGIPLEEMKKRVSEALSLVGMAEFTKKEPARMSGGQKQRVAIAGIIAMEPKCIVLDEPTAMLDPVGRRDVMETIERLNKEEGITVILITHYMDEAVRGDKVYVIDDGDLVMKGTPREIFVQVEKLKEYGLDVPQVTEVTYLLRKEGIDLPADILTVEEMVGALCQFN